MKRNLPVSRRVKSRPETPKTKRMSLVKISGGGCLAAYSKRLGKTRSKIGGSIERLTLGKKIDDELLDELEEVLITADLGMTTTIKLIDGLRGKVKRKELDDAEALKKALKDGVVEALSHAPEPPGRDNHPHVVLVVGVNGVGKTTSIGKLAHHFSSQGKKVMLAAGDTFRAAAAEQLGIWAERTGSAFVRQKEGADPSGVAYGAVESALSKEVDLVLIDTAGRLHTKVNLMDELKKIHRVVGKKLPGAPHEVLLVLDATTGQNALNQAKLFNEAVPLTGVVLTKLDGTAKGGIVVAITHELKLPVCFIGLGEGVDDLRPFDADQFAEALF
jgi:fused signal recognition particle receptor